MSNIEIIVVVLGFVFTITGSYMALRLKPLEDRVTIQDERISSFHDDVKEEREKFERRLSDVERSYLSRADLTSAVRDMRESTDKGIDRIEQIIRALGAKVDHLAERVVKVEGAS